ncbi:MAG: SLC13 family permease [Nitrospirota bacterium]|nr:SLC13 family permease [Nitrospirota bacterium]
MITALIVFLITYVFVGLTQVPRIPINRPAGALVGAVLMVVTGVLTLDQAFSAIDMHTLLLLLGMMIITVYLRTAGFFELMAERILSVARTPQQLLVLVSLASALLSALFVNDTICLLFTPILLEVTIQAGVNPLPYLLALATASNIGSVMTITGNPQNMLIGIASGIPYLSFLQALAPVAAIGIAVSIAVIRLVYRREITSQPFSRRAQVSPVAVDRPLLIKSLIVSGGVLVLFSLGHPYPLVAVAGAVALMLVGKKSTEQILEGVDWTLLLFFAGLFIVMHGVEVSGLAEVLLRQAGALNEASPINRIAGLSLVSAVLSNVVSNVPAVMLLRPLVNALGGDQIAWLTLAMSSTLAGNFTLIGSVANLIVLQQARKRVTIGFFEYFRVGALITVITIAAGILVLVVGTRTARGEEQPAQMRTLTVSPAGGGTQRNYRIVLVCTTEKEKAKGLQGFRKLASDEAALFRFDPPESTTFWMASVSYPIDILFVEQGGSVVRTYHDRRPGSRELYPSGGPVTWVIETAGGSGIKQGDRVTISP